MKSFENRNEGLIASLVKTKKINNAFLPKGLNLNIFVVNTITTIISSCLSVAAGFDHNITFKFAMFSFITTQLVMYFVLNYSHIKNSLSIFSYLLVFSLQVLLFLIAKNNYNVEYELLNNNIKISQLNEQIRNIEALELHKGRLEKQLNIYREMNKEKDRFQNMSCPEAVNVVDNFINENMK